MLFDSSVRKELARSFGGTLIVLFTIVVTLMLIRTLGLAARGEVAPGDVVLLLGYILLGQLPMLLSLSLFVALVSVLGRMYRDSEMVVWFSAGQPLGSFVRPALRLAWPVILGVFLITFFARPWAQQHSDDLRARYEKRSDLSRVAPGQFQTSANGRRVFFIDKHGGDDTGAQNIGRNVFILNQDNRQETITTAQSGKIVFDPRGRELLLDHGQRTQIDAQTGTTVVSKFDTSHVHMGDTVVDSGQNLLPRAMASLDLLAAPSKANWAELCWRAGMTLATFNLVFLGVGLSASNPRRGSNWNLVLGLLTFVVYFNLINLSQAWVASGRAHLGPTLAAIHGTAFVIGWAILRWRDGLLLPRRG